MHSHLRSKLNTVRHVEFLGTVPAALASTLHHQRERVQDEEEERVTLLIASRTIEGESVIELHGWLSGPEIAEFQGACVAKSVPFRIHLENLAGASADGILALREQQARGARLTGASPYIRLLLGGRPDGDGTTGAGPGTGT